MSITWDSEEDDDKESALVKDRREHSPGVTFWVGLAAEIIIIRRRWMVVGSLFYFLSLLCHSE